MTTATPFRFVWEKTVRGAGLGRGQYGVSVLAVALVLATYANADGTSVRPGVSRVATGAGVSTRTVDRALDRLRSEGYLHKVRNGNSRAGVADEYRLTLPDGPSSVTDQPTDTGADHPTSVPDRPTSVTGSPDAPGVPPVQRPDHHQPIKTSAPAKATEGGWTRAAQQAKGDSVA